MPAERMSLDLSYPVILGQDWPKFPELLQTLPLMPEPEEDNLVKTPGVLVSFKDPDLLTS